MIKEKRCMHCKCFDNEVPSDYDGWCTRYPNWITVSSLHYCGEFKECEEHE